MSDHPASGRSQPDIVATAIDRELARAAMDEGYQNCKRRLRLENLRQSGETVGEPCDCDLGSTNGCKARVDAIAKIIVTARNSASGRSQPGEGEQK